MHRIITLDFIKALAILFVITAHLLFLDEPDSIMYTLNSICSCIGVPLFMCTSGALILRKNFSLWINIKKFYIKNLLSIVITGEIWILVYYFLNTHNFSFKELLLNMFFIHKPEIHLWYIRMIILYYIAIPFITQVFKKKIIMILIIACILCSTFIYNGLLIYNGEKFPTTSGLSYSCYLIYLLGGYFISLRKSKSININVIIVILGISAILLFLTHYNNNYMIWYDNPFILVISLSLFELIYRATENIDKTHHSKFYNLISDFSSMTFGIYLIHMIFILILRYYLPEQINYLKIEYSIYPLALIVLLLSILSIKISKRISAKITYLLFRY